MYKLIVFDLDGTLLDTSEGIVKAVEDTIHHFNLRELDREKLKRFIGPPIQNSFREIYHLSEDKLSEVVGHFRKIYSEHYLFLARPYDKIYELFNVLNENKIEIAIATYKREDYLYRLLERFEIDKYVHIAYGADMGGRLTKKDIIQKCIENAGIEKNKDVLMIGDTEHDAWGAEQIGADFLGVTYGFGFSEASLTKNAIGFVNNVDKIIETIIRS